MCAPSPAKSLMRKQLRHEWVGGVNCGRSSGGPLANLQDLYGPLQHAFEFTRFEKNSPGMNFLRRRDFPRLALTHRFAIAAFHDHV